MYLAEVLPGIPGFDSSMSVSKWYEKWMELYKVRNLKATTIRNYEDGFRRTEEYIGYMKLVDIKPEHIQISGHSTQKMTEYYTHLEQGYVKDEYKRYDEKYGKES